MEETVTAEELACRDDAPEVGSGGGGAGEVRHVVEDEVFLSHAMLVR